MARGQVCSPHARAPSAAGSNKRLHPTPGLSPFGSAAKGPFTPARVSRSVRLASEDQVSLETIFKVAFTVGVTAVWIWSVRWVWTAQVDPRATVSKLVAKPFEAPDWVATRDPTKIYQDGRVVGDVIGDATSDGKEFRFEQLVNTGELKRDSPIEYQRYRLRIVGIQAIIGMKSSVSDQGSQVLSNVMEGVTCDILQP